MRRVVPRALVAILLVVPLASRVLGDGSLMDDVRVDERMAPSRHRH